MVRKLLITLASVGVELSYNFDSHTWIGTKQPSSDADDITLLNPRSSYPAADIALLISDIETAASYLKACSQCVNDKLLPLDKLPIPPGRVDYVAWGREPVHLCPYHPWGQDIFFTENEDIPIALEQFRGIIFYLFETFADLPPIVKGALAQNYKHAGLLFLKCNKTGNCVSWSTEDPLWKECSEEPTGEASRVDVGITSYISGEVPELDDNLLSIGFDFLAKSVAANFPIEILMGVPEFSFSKAPSDGPFAINTNNRQLLYYMNADLPDPPIVKATTVQFLEMGDNAIQCGGACLISGGDNSYDMVSIISNICSMVSSYSDFVSKYNDSTLPAFMKQEFDDKFSNPRVGHEPGEPDNTFPIQLSDGINRYAWCGGHWAPMYQLDTLYPGTAPAPYNMEFSFIDTSVTMTNMMWTHLLTSIISQFQSPIPGLASLYYIGHEAEAYDGEINIEDKVQDVCMKYVPSLNSWVSVNHHEEFEDVTSMRSGFSISVSKPTSISTQELATILTECNKMYNVMHNQRMENKDSLIADTIYGTWDLVESCITADIYCPTNKVSSTPYQSPLAVYKAGRRATHSARGWHLTPLPTDHSTKIDNIGFLPGNHHIDSALIADYLNMSANMDDEATKVSHMIGATSF